MYRTMRIVLILCFVLACCRLPIVQARSATAAATAAFISQKKNTSTQDREKIQRKCSSHLSLTKEEGILSGLGEISLGCSSAVLWSEYAVITTGCGPLNLPNWLERGCYQGVIIFAGMSLFNRIVTRQNLVSTCRDLFPMMTGEGMVAAEIELSEWASLVAVLGAFAALAVQTANGSQMDGLSGINIELCRVVQDVYTEKGRIF